MKESTRVDNDSNTDQVEQNINTDEQAVQAFKDAFARHAAGVAIMTAVSPDGNPVGFTGTSLASLSAEPPRATFNIAQTASSYPSLTPGAHVAVHFLGQHMVDVAKRFATDTEKRFVGDHWHWGPHNLPIVDGYSAVLYTTVAKVFPMSSNAVVVLDILGGDFSDTDAPLLYHQRKFHGLRNLDG